VAQAEPSWVSLPPAPENDLFPFSPTGADVATDSQGLLSATPLSVFLSRARSLSLSLSHVFIDVVTPGTRWGHGSSGRAPARIHTSFPPPLVPPKKTPATKTSSVKGCNSVILGSWAQWHIPGGPGSRVQELKATYTTQSSSWHIIGVSINTVTLPCFFFPQFKINRKKCPVNSVLYICHRAI
jgi:hypothetical protein